MNINNKQKKLIDEGKSFARNCYEHNLKDYGENPSEYQDENLKFSTFALESWFEGEFIPELETVKTSKNEKNLIKENEFFSGYLNVNENDDFDCFFLVHKDINFSEINLVHSWLTIETEYSIFGFCLQIKLMLCGKTGAVDTCMIKIFESELEKINSFLRGKGKFHFCKFTQKKVLHLNLNFNKFKDDLLKIFANQIKIEAFLKDKKIAKIRSNYFSNFQKLSKNHLLIIDWKVCLKNSLLDELDERFLSGYGIEDIEEDDSRKHVLLNFSERRKKFLEAVKKENNKKINDFILPLFGNYQEKSFFIDTFYSYIEKKKIKELFLILNSLQEIDKKAEIIFVQEIMRVCNLLLFYKFSNYGTEFPYFNTKENSVKYFVIEVDKMGKSLCSTLWYDCVHSFLFDLNNFDLELKVAINDKKLAGLKNKVISEPKIENAKEGNFSDFDIVYPEKSIAENIKLTSETKETKVFLSNLMDEAVSNKINVIPPYAFSDITIGGFKGITLNEINDRVYFQLHYSDFFVLRGYIDVIEKKFWFSHEVATLNDRLEEFQCAILCLVISLIRDHWVIEFREKLFKQKVVRSSSSSDSKVSIIYIPRIRYIGTINIKNCESEINLTSRAKHFVKAHIRKSQTSSEIQKILARQYNYHLPEGFTFVRPHERGDIEKIKIYRSRSVSNLLTTEFNNIDEGKVDWFKWERDVGDWFKKQGFKVEVTNATGDGGIDVKANKITNEGLENWIIQCKAWKRPVGRNIVDELLGVNTRLGGDNKLMIATLGRFEPAAEKIAQENDVVLVTGKDFVECNLGFELN